MTADNAKPQPVVLSLAGVSKSYPGVRALSDIDLTLHAGEVLGIAGENGAGKTTLISIINGTVVPDAGEMTVHGQPFRFGSPRQASQAGIATVYQEQGLVPSMRVYENMLLGRESSYTFAGMLDQRGMRRNTQAMLDELGVDIDANSYTAWLSFSQRQQVEIAKAFMAGESGKVAPIILLDEPTSALAEDEIDRFLANIEAWRSRASFILISHRLAHLFRATDRIAVFKDGSRSATLRTAETDEEQLHELIVGRKHNSEYYREAKQREPEEQIVASLDGLTAPGSFANVSLTIRAGEIVGLGGVQGCGKTEVARAVAGLKDCTAGSITIGDRAVSPGSVIAAVRSGIAYVPAERLVEGVIVDNSVEFNVTLPNLRKYLWAATPILDTGRTHQATQSWIERLSIKVAGPGALMRTMSGGNQQKAVFAKWLTSDVRLLVLDDPGRGLDVGAKEDIYDLLRELSSQGVAILLVSDNLPELIGLSHTIHMMRAGEITGTAHAPPNNKPTEAQLVRFMV